MQIDGRRGAQTGRATGLVYVVWELTLRCDLACRHCGSRAGKARDDELSTDEALEVVRQLADLGAQEITMIGGEAYLRDDWTTIAAAIVRAGMKCTMTTGGRGLTRERARAAKEAGISGISVSIDGLEHAHDRQRGLKGSFRAALDALDALALEEVPLLGNTQVNRISLPDLDSVLQLLIDRRARGWQVQLTVPMGRAADRPDWLLQPYELLELYPRLASLAQHGAAHGCYFFPANNIGYFGPHEATLRGRGVRTDRAWGGCIAGKHAMGIESDGAIKGCPSLPTQSWTAGNVRSRSLRDLWDNERALRYIRERTVDDLWGYCRDCYYADTCRGGCTWTAEVFFGKPGNNPYCHHRALDHARRGLRERLVQVETAPGVPFDHGRFEAVVEPLDASEPRRRLPLIS